MTRQRVGEPTPGTPSTRPPSILVGILSSTYARRKVLRAEYETSSRLGIRLLFVVGKSLESSRNTFGALPDAEASDLFHALVREGASTVKTQEDYAKDISTEGTVTGTVTAMVKVWHFFKYAAHATEDIICKSDDDTYLSLLGLSAYAAALPSYAYAGVFEWTNWIPERLTGTGHSVVPQISLRDGLWLHNCTRTGIRKCAQTTASCGAVGGCRLHDHFLITP